METVTDPRINPYTGEVMHAVVIVKPGYDTVRIGPFGFKHQTEGWISTLNFYSHGTAKPEGTTWKMTGYDPALPHDDPDGIPTEMGDLAFAIGNDTSSGEAAFPDLFTRLQCQVGTDEAMELWGQACRYADWVAEDEGEDD